MANTIGGPAFPVAGDERNAPVEGMTLRDYFAGQALAGMLANPEFDFVGAGAQNRGIVTQEAYILADAMLKERET